MTQKNNVGVKIIAAGVVGMLIGGVAIAGYTNDNSTVDKLNAEIAVLKDLPVPEAEIVEVEVDGENLGIVLNHIFDNDGEIGYLTDDLDDDEVEQITDRVIFINEIRDEAVKAIKSDLYDEIDKTSITLDDASIVILDEDEMARLRIDNDADELAVTGFDWDEKEAIVSVTGSFRQDGVDFDFSADVLFDDGVYDELDNIVITEQ